MDRLIVIHRSDRSDNPPGRGFSWKRNGEASRFLIAAHFFVEHDGAEIFAGSRLPVLAKLQAVFTTFLNAVGLCKTLVLTVG